MYRLDEVVRRVRWRAVRDVDEMARLEKAFKPLEQRRHSILPIRSFNGFLKLLISRSVDVVPADRASTAPHPKFPKLQNYFLEQRNIEYV